MARHPQVHFRLKPEDEEGKRLIYLQFLYNKNRLFYSFGQRVKEKDWSSNKQRVKKNNATTADGKSLLNDLLDSLERECERAYNVEMRNGIPAPETIKNYLVSIVNQNEHEDNQQNLFNLIDRFINGEIKANGRDKSPNTIKTYRTVKGHLEGFQKQEKYKFDFDSIDINFYYKYVSYLRNRNNPLSTNAISKDIQILKVFMNEAVDLGYTANLQFKHKKFAVSRVETDSVFLTETEIIHLYRFDFSENKKLERVRDLFVFGCFVGLRFSDFSNVKRENIIEKDGESFIKMITQKTSDLVWIPCNPVVLDIFKKYEQNNNRLPNRISGQKFNEYVKQVCKKAGLVEKGRLSTNPKSELWELVTSHTARRSFATNLYLEGFPTIDLMKITGHKTERAFMKYIRISKLDAAKRLSSHMKARWSEKMLRIAG
jgi:integrase